MTFQAGPNGEGVLQKAGPIAAVTRLAITAIIRPAGEGGRGGKEGGREGGR